ncbi:MAG: hypothetical protein SNF60_06510, partial [Rikenellaceae bacterium]
KISVLKSLTPPYLYSLSKPSLPVIAGLTRNLIPATYSANGYYRQRLRLGGRNDAWRAGKSTPAGAFSGG